jgi:hypothetical protein
VTRFPSGLGWVIPEDVTTVEWLARLWRDYVALAPHAARIHQLLTERGELLGTDHLAFRTFGVPGIGMAEIAQPFEARGWRPRDHYELRDRQLRARYWQHDDPALPKLLVSELMISELSPGAQAVISGLLAQLPAALGDLPLAGRPWRVSYAEYRALLGESDYAAWIAAFGFRVHAVAADFGSLSTFPDLEALAAFLIEHGFGVNDVLGSRAEHLERLSTRPDSVAVSFTETTAEITARIPSCSYELVRRYRLASGELFHGFAASSSDPIFAPADLGISPTG